jgi:hypothetical protein
MAARIGRMITDDIKDVDAMNRSRGSWRRMMIILLPYDLEHPSRLCNGLWEIKEYCFRVALNGITSIPDFMQVCPPVSSCFTAEHVIPMTTTISTEICKRQTGQIKPIRRSSLTIERK